MTRDAPQGGDAASISEQLPRRRRRLGLALVGLGVAALAAQSWVEWLLPYDLAALEAMRRLSGQPTLSPAHALAGPAGMGLGSAVRCAVAGPGA